MVYQQTDRTTPTRKADRVSYDRTLVESVLDEALVCDFAFVVDGVPHALPTLFARIDDTLYLHASTGSGPALTLTRNGGGPAAGTPTVCVTVTLLDGLVLARSQNNHSVNYRSVVAYGTPRLVTDEAEKRESLAVLVDKVARGRAADTRPPNAKELAKVAVLALPLTEVSAKARRGAVIDDPDDLSLPNWAGVVPLTVTRGMPEPAEEMAAPVPGYLRPTPANEWLEPVVLRGSRVLLEPLDMSHVDGLFTALDDEELHQHLLRPRPADRSGTEAFVAEALAAAHAGHRVPYVQRDPGTGEIIGTTSYISPDPHDRKVAIGYTAIGRRWWRTGVNPESKLLLMRRAFEDLGAVRVEWQTDVRNLRSQAAIEGLGATWEGVLRKNRRRPDGTWRDSVLYSLTIDEWPATRDRLTARLARG
jgi:uncharacterized protein